ncbi:uncharacterized protein isoform X1 [Takifugu rubripes]|uniref:uncharacterized protein isoform X1 n=1 Tax=Takifugu rubripes TaxID=31033 RepID=UPI00114551D3|nr:uncharacterized protein LOC115251815 [Takifugu rubripes]
MRRLTFGLIQRSTQYRRDRKAPADCLQGRIVRRGAFYARPFFKFPTSERTIVKVTAHISPWLLSLKSLFALWSPFERRAESLECDWKPSIFVFMTLRRISGGVHNQAEENKDTGSVLFGSGSQHVHKTERTVALSGKGFRRRTRSRLFERPPEENEASRRIAEPSPLVFVGNQPRCVLCAFFPAAYEH